MITFTGSTHTGKRLLTASGESTMKHVQLECGGKSANIVFADCPDLDGVAKAVTTQMYWNRDANCT